MCRFKEMEPVINKNAIIITGGPGMGKTSVIDRLRNMGYLCIAESGRAIIQQQLGSGGDKLPWADRQGFAGEMFRMAVDDYYRVQTNNSLTFFDRGLPDIAGYLALCNLSVSKEMQAAVQQLRYCRQVFITPPWPEIYTTDNERKQSFSEATATYEMMVAIYSNLGYVLVSIPPGPVEERAMFIIRQIEQQ